MASAARDPGRQRLALEMLHHQVGNAVVIAEIVNRANVRVRERRDGPGLPFETGAAAGIDGEAGGKTLTATVRPSRASWAR